MEAADTEKSELRDIKWGSKLQPMNGVVRSLSACTVEGRMRRGVKRGLTEGLPMECSDP